MAGSLWPDQSEREDLAPAGRFGPRQEQQLVVMAGTSEAASLEELLEQLRSDLKTEAEAIAQEPRLSMRERQQRYLRHVKKYDAARLNRQKPPLESTDRASAREQVDQSMEDILEEVGCTRTLSRVSEPPSGVKPLPITVEGAIAEPEFPDRPPDDAPGRLAEWSRQIAEYAPTYAAQYEITREIQRSHGLFEEAMPPASLDRLIFRMPLEQEWMLETRRNHLVIRAEILLRKYLAELPPTTSPPITVPPLPPEPGADVGRTATIAARRSTPNPSRRTETVKAVITTEKQRGRRRRATIGPVLRLLGWSRYNWADATAEQNHGHAVAYTTIKRYMNGITKCLRADTELVLRMTLRKALLDFAARSPDTHAAQLAKRLDRPLPA